LTTMPTLPCEGSTMIVDMLPKSYTGGRVIYDPEQNEVEETPRTCYDLTDIPEHIKISAMVPKYGMNWTRPKNDAQDVYRGMRRDMFITRHQADVRYAMELSCAVREGFVDCVLVKNNVYLYTPQVEAYVRAWAEQFGTVRQGITPYRRRKWHNERWSKVRKAPPLEFRSAGEYNVKLERGRQVWNAKSSNTTASASA